MIDRWAWGWKIGVGRFVVGWSLAGWFVARWCCFGFGFGWACCRVAAANSGIAAGVVRVRIARAWAVPA